jgi:serine/threonine-protein kinase
MYGRFAAFHTYFLALEFCDGTTLDHVLSATGPLPESAVRKIAGQLAAGLGYAHRAGVMHRDLKPANAMVTHEGTVRLMDFGLAQPVAERAGLGEGAMVGTPAYMAPEQLLGQPLTLAADLFAFGAMIWEMLVGRRLMGQATIRQLLSAHAAWMPPKIRESLPEVSDELASVIEACLARSPADRRVDLSALAAWSGAVDVSCRS